MLLGDKFEKIEVLDAAAQLSRLTETRWARFTRLLRQYQGWQAALQTAYGHGTVTFIEQARLLQDGIAGVDALLASLTDGATTEDGHRFEVNLLDSDERLLVLHTIEKKTGLSATYRVPRAAIEATEYRRLQSVHSELAGLVGQAPFSVTLADSKTEAHSFEELRDAILEVSQKGVNYYRFKGLGEMDPEELRETTMDPSTRTLAQVTMEDATAADSVFSMLMGDQVEPRRQFIEENARLVTNLDI